MRHIVKCLPLYFEPAYENIKQYEVRINDRKYEVGDYIVMREWSMFTGYSGRALLGVITHILYPSSYVPLKVGYVILGVEWLVRGKWE